MHQKMFRQYPYGKLPLSKRNTDRKLRRLISFTVKAFLKLDLICFYENKNIADLIDELLNERWESEEKEIMESTDIRLARLRCSNVFRKLAKVKVPRGRQQLYGKEDQYCIKYKIKT